MSEHGVTSTDEMVRGYPGTVARCDCGVVFAWAVRDGSAECDGHMHMMAVDPEYRERQEAATARWHQEQADRDAAYQARPLGFHGPQPEPHHHDCSCHIAPPCGMCENCRHVDHPMCPNDCQTCEDHNDD